MNCSDFTVKNAFFIIMKFGIDAAPGYKSQTAVAGSQRNTDVGHVSV